MRIIYSPLLKTHIDLDAISAIDDAQICWDHGWSVYFKIHLKLHDKPLCHSRYLDWNRGEYRVGDSYALEVKLTNGEWLNPDHDARSLEEPEKIVATVNLQKEINDLISSWRGQPFSTGGG